MKNTQRIQKPLARRVAFVVAMLSTVAALTACSHAMMMLGTGAKKPAASEFGLGPRTSASGRYLATLAPERPLRTREMQTVRVTVTDAASRPIDDAVLTVDGGMPEHGHGLPTRPRVTRSLGGGTYEIEGVRFSMGGWWEFKVVITSAGATDSVTFNLEL